MADFSTCTEVCVIGKKKLSPSTFQEATTKEVSLFSPLSVITLTQLPRVKFLWPPFLLHTQLFLFRTPSERNRRGQIFPELF